MWEYRGGELFGGTFGVGYSGFLFSTALILKFFVGPMIAAAGAQSLLVVLAISNLARQLRRRLPWRGHRA